MIWSVVLLPSRSRSQQWFKLYWMFFRPVFFLEPLSLQPNWVCWSISNILITRTKWAYTALALDALFCCQQPFFCLVSLWPCLWSFLLKPQNIWRVPSLDSFEAWVGQNIAYACITCSPEISHSSIFQYFWIRKLCEKILGLHLSIQGIDVYNLYIK